jgi:hypothetical protein
MGTSIENYAIMEKTATSRFGWMSNGHDESDFRLHILALQRLLRYLRRLE